MKISPYLKIKRIEFIVTYHCTGRCLHCSVGDMLGNCEGGHHVRTDRAAEAVRKLAEHFDVSSVMTFGGEPLLYPEVVCAVHSAAEDAGIPKRQLITNGYFSRDKENIAKVAGKLAEAGVNEVLLSVDDFHQMRIPVEYPYCFAEELIRNNIQKLKLSPAWVVNSSAENEYNARTKKWIGRFEPLGITVGSGNDIFMAGHAVDNLSGYYPAPKVDLMQKCGSMPYTAPLTDVTSVSVEPNGDMVACAVVIGNIYRDSIEDIIERYDPFTDERMCAVMNGAEAMLAYAEKHGIDVDISKCYSVCDICRMINRK